MTRRVPDFFIVGQPKAGTTALHATLSHHPQIYMPTLKEPSYFARELAHNSPSVLPTTFDQYMSLFAPADSRQLAGEATTLYLWSRTAARSIADAQPDARIIIILREPADFLRSLHLQLVKVHIESEPDLRSALELEEERRNGRHLPHNGYWPQLLFYSEHMRYIDQLRRYQDAFPADRLLILIYDDYRRDNRAIVREILRFLGLDDTVPLSTSDANRTARLRARRIKDLMDSVSQGRGAGFATFKAGVETVTTQRMRRAAQNLVGRHIIYGKPRRPDHGLVAEIRRRYKPEVQALTEYLGRDLTQLWGYNDIE